MPTISQLPPSSQISSADEIPVSQGGTARAVSIGTFLASTQPAIIVGSPALIGRTSLGSGGPEQVDVGIGLNLAAGTLTTTGMDHAGFPILGNLSAEVDLVISNEGSPMLMQASLLRELFSAGQNIAIDPNGVISATGTATTISSVTGSATMGVSGSAISVLPVVASLASQDLVSVSHAGSDCAIAYSNLLEGLTIDQGQTSGPVSDTDTIWAAQGGNVMTAQNFSSIWAWVQGKMLTYRAPTMEIVNNTILDPILHNGRFLICSQPVTFTPLSGNVATGFQSTVINASSGNVTLGSGFVSSSGNLTLAPWQSATIVCATYSTGTVTFATVSGAGSYPSVPSQINTLVSSGATSTTLSVSWQASLVGSTVVNYVIQYRVSGATAWSTSYVSASLMSYQIVSLLPATSYDIIIQGQNAAGQGPSSSILTLTTSVSSQITSPAQATAPSQVVGVSASALSSSTMQVTWQGQTGSNAAVSYIIQYRVTGTTNWLTSAASSNIVTFTVSNLQANTKYDAAVLGVNSLGNGPTSTVATATTLVSSQMVTSIVWNSAPSGTYARGSGAIAMNVHVAPSSVPIQFGFSSSSSTPPTSWEAAVLVNTDLWGQYLSTPSTAGTWYSWAEGLDGSALTVNPTPFIVQ